MKKSNKALTIIVAAVAATTLLAGGTLALAATRTGAVPRPIDAISKLLGLDRTKIESERASGKSLVDIAKAKGVDQDKLIETMVAARKAKLDAAVKAGRITRAQADKALDLFKKQVKDRANNTGECKPFGLDGTGRRGRGPDGQGAGRGAGRGAGGAGRGAGPGGGAGMHGADHGAT